MPEQENMPEQDQNESLNPTCEFFCVSMCPCFEHVDVAIRINMLSVWFSIFAGVCAAVSTNILTSSLGSNDSKIYVAENDAWCHMLLMKHNSLVNESHTIIEAGRLDVASFSGGFAATPHSGFNSSHQACEELGDTFVEAVAFKDNCLAYLALSITAYYVLRFAKFSFVTAELASYGAAPSSTDKCLGAAFNVDVVRCKHDSKCENMLGVPKCMPFGLAVNFVVLSWMPASLLAPLSSAYLHDERNDVIIMQFNFDWWWYSFVVCSAILVLWLFIGFGLFWEQGRCNSHQVIVPEAEQYKVLRIVTRLYLFLFRLCLLAGCLCAISLTILNALSVNLAAVLFIDLRLLFRISLTDGLALWAGILRICCFMTMILDFAVLCRLVYIRFRGKVDECVDRNDPQEPDVTSSA